MKWRLPRPPRSASTIRAPWPASCCSKRCFRGKWWSRQTKTWAAQALRVSTSNGRRLPVVECSRNTGGATGSRKARVGHVQVAKGGDRYLLAQVRDRMDFPSTLLAVRQMCGTWPAVSLKLVEDKANGPAVVQSLSHQIAGFVEVNPEGGKISRAAAASPQLESGNWYLPHPQLAPWVDGFITECAAFPGSLNDDQVDAWSQGAHRLMAVVGKRPLQVPPERHASERSWMV